MKYILATFVDGDKTGEVRFKSLKDLSAQMEAYKHDSKIHVCPLYLESLVKPAWDVYVIMTYIWTY